MKLLTILLLTITAFELSGQVRIEYPLGGQGIIFDTTWTSKPDTLRATLIVYLSGGTLSILHTKPGFVVRQWAKDNVYLDDKKKVIKAPVVVYDYRVSNKINYQ